MQVLLSTFWSWSTWWRWLKVPRSTSWPLSRTWMPSFRSDPNAMYSARAQSTVRFVTSSLRVFKIRLSPPWMVKFSTGTELATFPMWVKMSSSRPVEGQVMLLGCPSRVKKPGQGESSQCLMCKIFSSLDLVNASSQILSYLEISSSYSGWLTTPWDTSNSAYFCSTGFCLRICLYMSGCVNIGSSISLWPFRR